jgi:hypothetical protein
MRPKAKLVVSACLVALAIGLGLVELPVFGSVWQRVTASPWDRERVGKSQVIAREIIDALSRYHATEGAYPDELSDLIPGHLARIPRPVAGCRDWTYRLDEYKGYVLGFHAPGHYPSAYYAGAWERWGIND